MRTRTKRRVLQAVYVPLRSLLNERHRRSATRSALECAKAHSILLCILKYDVFVFVQRICKDQSEYTTGNHFADTYRQHHERNW